MAEIRETHTIKEKGDGNGATPWLAFIVGALLIAVVCRIVDEFTACVVSTIGLDPCTVRFSVRAAIPSLKSAVIVEPAISSTVRVAAAKPVIR